MMALHAKWLCAILAIALSVCPLEMEAQDRFDAPTDETVANLAAGRVVIAVVKDAILVGTIENPIEAETRPPVPVEISATRLGVILGAVEWTSPSTQQEIARLDQELPHLRSRSVPSQPHLGGTEGGDEAVDIEAIGQGLLERLNDVAKNLHGKINLPANEPLAELIVADYIPTYGAEIWQLAYMIKQQEEQRDYWTTRVLRPSYLQFWPPEKGQPRTLVEFSYPPGSAPPTLLELLRQKDPRLEKIRASDPKMAEVADHFLQGTSNKALAADTIQFLRAALDAIAPPNARETMAIIRQETGFEWILAPPPEPVHPGQKPSRPPDAPTLIKPPQ
jgi:hypothetical protein